MVNTQTKKSGGNKRHGKNSNKCKLYRQNKTREKNKAKRILQSSGKKSCEKYCKMHSIKLPDRYYKIKEK